MGPRTQEQERKWAIALHLSALAGLLFPPLFLVGPWIVWWVGRPSATIDRQGRRAINFQLTVLAILVAIVLALVVAADLGVRPSVPAVVVGGFVLTGALIVVQVLAVSRACIAVSNGEEGDYPLAIRFLRVRPAKATRLRTEWEEA